MGVDLDTKKTWQKKKPPTDFEIQLGRRIRECRERLALTTDDLADSLGLSSASIVQYELGIRSPSYERFVALADILGVSAGYLLCGKSRDETDTDAEADQLIAAFKRLIPRDRALVVEIIKCFIKSTSIEPEVT